MVEVQQELAELNQELDFHSLLVIQPGHQYLHFQVSIPRAIHTEVDLALGLARNDTWTDMGQHMSAVEATPLGLWCTEFI